MHDNDREVSSNVDIVLFTFSRFSFVDPGAAVMRKWHPSACWHVVPLLSVFVSVSVP